MKKKIAKALIDKAERETIGQNRIHTRKLYQIFKREWKALISSKQKAV